MSKVLAEISSSSEHSSSSEEEDSTSESSSDSEEDLYEECAEAGDGGDQAENDPVCLLCDQKLPVEELFVHLNDVHRLDLFQLRKKFRVDQESYIKLINFVRTQEKKIQDKKDIVESLMTCKSPVWNDDVYLQPVLNEDPLLTFWFESEEIEQEGGGSNGNDAPSDKMSSVGLSAAASHESFIGSTSENHELRRKNLQYEDALSEAYDQMQKMQEVMSRICLDNEKLSTRQILKKDTAATESDYFASYDDIGIHDQMLTDAPRTEAYQQAIIQNETDFKNKIILDVGCGTGILSMFAAKAGASKVFAVDRSKILDKAVEIVRENGFENVIECVRGTVESIKLPVDKVDIIISEWMGYFLLYEGMLSSVIEARKKFLKSGGSLYPNSSDLYIQGISDKEKYEHIRTKWNNVYGFKMTCLHDPLFSSPSVDPVREDLCATEPVNVLSLDLMTCENEDTSFEKKFTFKVTKQCEITAIIGYFDVGFTMGSNFKNVLSTSPANPVTHWNQSIFYLPKPISVTQGEELQGVFICRPNSRNPRWLDFTVTVAGDTYTYQMK